MYSGLILERYYLNGKIRKRFYRKDKDGYYYIPEVEKYRLYVKPLSRYIGSS
jgi:hypothetical protein